MPALAAAGFRAIAPDLRGYHRSDKPRGLSPYRLDRLAGDLGAILGDLSSLPIPIVAHDWGGAVAWWSALLFPERIERLLLLNVPHPLVFRRALASNPVQRKRSRYFVYFQLPFFPEQRLRRDGFGALRRMLVRMCREGTFSAADLDRYAASWARPGALRGMLAWYRAAFRRRPPKPPTWRVEPPVRIVWGTKDSALDPALIDPSAALCREARVVRVDSAGHWVHLEEPERVNRELLDFLGPLPIRSAGTSRTIDR